MSMRPAIARIFVRAPRAGFLLAKGGAFRAALGGSLPPLPRALSHPSRAAFGRNRRLGSPIGTTRTRGNSAQMIKPALLISSAGPPGLILDEA